MKSKLLTLAALPVLIFGLAGLAGCSSDADVANENITKDADNFKVLRRIVFYNGITEAYVLSIEGYCSIDPGDSNKMTVTCKVNGGYKRHYLGKSDNVTWFAEQIEPADVSVNHYKVIFKPSTIIPQPEIR